MTQALFNFFNWTVATALVPSVALIDTGTVAVSPVTVSPVASTVALKFGLACRKRVYLCVKQVNHLLLRVPCRKGGVE